MTMIGLSGIVSDIKTVVITILAFSVVFGILAFSHEFGHFLLAKMLGMSVDQFGIGFPPNYGWTLFRRSGTSYTLHPIPLGAFVKIQGMDPGDQQAPNSFMRRPPWARLIVFLAGSAANLVVAILVYTLMGVVVGIPTRAYVTSLVESVAARSAAAGAGIKSGDRVTAVRLADRPGTWVAAKATPKGDDATDMVEFVHHDWSYVKRRGKKVPVARTLLVQLIQKDGSDRILKVRPTMEQGQDGKPEAHLGYRPEVVTDYRKAGWIEAAASGFDQTQSGAFTLVNALGERIYQLVSRKISPNEFGQGFGGTVMIAKASGNAAAAGLEPFLRWLALLSINLAVLNLVPLPVFDGGNIVLVLVEMIRRKQLEAHQFMAVQLAGVALIICLFAYLTYNDIIHNLHTTLTP